MSTQPPTCSAPPTSAELAAQLPGTTIRDGCGNVWRKGYLGLWCLPPGAGTQLLSDWQLARLLSERGRLA